jgi:nucleoside 2-deoxyribosyltransferase
MHPAYDEKRAKDVCPLCYRAAMKGHSGTSGEVWSYICPVCGIFRVTERFLYDLPEKESSAGNLLYKVSYQFRQASQGLSRPVDLPVHKVSEIPTLLGHKDPSVQTKTELLLSFLGSASSFPGDLVTFDYSMDYPLISAQNSDEVLFFVESLSSQGLIDLNQYESEAQSVTVCKLTTSGWKELDRINQSGSTSANAFIAMAFSSDRDPFREAIRIAVQNAGYVPIRIDEVEHINHIDDQIIAEIRRSKFLISDSTLQRNGVYFEAGFMLGLGRPVIWLCEKEDMKNVHFDIRQYNTIDYKDAIDLQTRLQFRIEAILGQGPHKEN